VSNDYLNEVLYSDGSYYKCPPELSATIHVVPKPATLLLLSLGAVMVKSKLKN
jgi:hypothetical protein